MKYSLVLPNLSSFRSRGKLAQRWSLAEDLGCEIMELPADMVKSVAEEVRTGQTIGDVLTESSVESLYGAPLPEGRSILHTDPGIPRKGRDGRMVFPDLKWNNEEWSERYARSIGRIVRTIGGKVEGVEVHPGIERRSLGDLATGFRYFSRALASSLNDELLITVENKHRHRVDSVESMAEVMDLLPSDRFGLVIDISNLWKTYRRHTAEAMEQLPWGRVRAVHLHLRHKAPDTGDPVDWPLLFDVIKEKAGELFINPEVFHQSELEKALAMIREKLSWP